MIVDCFAFFNEFEILELRLRTLEDVVDRFVLCEAGFTHRGDPKPLLFGGQAERFARWRDRMTVL
jgi:beta-1,4-mannosyl-glycoprotein beta-1,4-N-acetylglucosaminyltransferase